MKSRITIIVMTSSTCNIDCDYCYMKASRRNIGVIDADDVPALIRNCSTGFDDVEFCWHGGEPLLAGQEFYRRAIQAQRDMTALQGTVFRNVLQTNGLLLNESWIELLKSTNISFGFSFDAPPEVHSLHRGDNGSRVVAAWELARAANLPVGAICVVSKHNVHNAREIFDFFTSHGITSYSFLPLRAVPARDLPPLPDNDEVFELFRNTFELWLNRQNEVASIEPISTMIKALVDGRPKLCSFSASCPEGMISIDQSGNVIPCCSLVEERFVMGNIFSEYLSDIIKRGKEPFVQLRKTAVTNSCAHCEFVSICNGGCRADAYWASGRYDGPYPYCEARKRTFEYLESRLKGFGVLA
jgi:uncharacterized protein